MVDQTDLCEVPVPPESRAAFYGPGPHLGRVETDLSKDERVAKRPERVVLLHHQGDKISIRHSSIAITAIVSKIITQLSAISRKTFQPPLIKTE